eukprot:249090-Ditylum_brightwellii.AAC.1
MVAKQSKAVDIRLHWLKCREAQHQFSIRWEKDSCNRADYYSKRHPPAVSVAAAILQANSSLLALPKKHTNSRLGLQ